MSQNGRIYLSPPHLSGNETSYVQHAIASNWIAPAGPDLALFERGVAEVSGTANAAAVSSGTAAIHLCLHTMGVGPGDAVFCSDLTFAGSCNPILYQGAEPVFIDSEPGSLNMSPRALEKALADAKAEGRLPKVVIVVDLYGRPADYGALLPLCEKYGVPVLEDAAEALGASYQGRPCGCFGKAGVFSFNGNKIITTSGGGMAVSDDAEFIGRVRFLSTQAKLPLPYYEHEECGYNYRLSNLLAALGRGQLEGLRGKVARRREIYGAYKEAFRGLPLRMLPVMPDTAPNYWLSVALLDDGAPLGPLDLVKALDALDIQARPVWKPMHLQPLFAGRRFYPHGEKAVSEDAFRRGVCFPSGSALTAVQQQKITRAVRELLRG